MVIILQGKDRLVKKMSYKNLGRIIGFWLYAISQLKYIAFEKIVSDNEESLSVNILLYFIKFGRNDNYQVVINLLTDLISHNQWIQIKWWYLVNTFTDIYLP